MPSPPPPLSPPPPPPPASLATLARHPLPQAGEGEEARVSTRAHPCRHAESFLSAEPLPSLPFLNHARNAAPCVAAKRELSETPRGRVNRNDSPPRLSHPVNKAARQRGAGEYSRAGHQRNARRRARARPFGHRQPGAGAPRARQ